MHTILKTLISQGETTYPWVKTVITAEVGLNLYILKLQHLGTCNFTCLNFYDLIFYNFILF